MVADETLESCVILYRLIISDLTKMIQVLTPSFSTSKVV